jgi:hypothetical protein
MRVDMSLFRTGLRRKQHQRLHDFNVGDDWIFILVVILVLVYIFFG